jgi:hypothetical protein
LIWIKASPVGIHDKSGRKSDFDAWVNQGEDDEGGDDAQVQEAAGTSH